ncbi:hypothetical protein [Geomonas sp.]|uniref:hypothetical protein n=1 Tax=Geomonas sp. TaxID=2651584 RepID=UPI002B494EFB|nr:hypothetical protein [Geomonas sp.]HJV36998.1 hypothetical protein [Geomonas sp.]
MNQSPDEKSSAPRGVSLRAMRFPLALVLLAGVCLLTSLAGAGSPPPKERSGPPVKELPRPLLAQHPNPLANELEVLSVSAEETYEVAISGKLDRLPKKFEAVKKSAASLPAMQDEANANLLPHLKHTITELEQAVNSKDRLDVMRFSNRVSLIAATLAVPLKPCVPTEVSLLDYNARELAIWAELKRMERLSSIVIRMHLAWQALMPKLVDHNATRELRRFSDLMGHLEAAKSSEEYSRLSRQLSSELTGLRMVFARK